MTLADLRTVLGEPARQFRFADDRLTYEFTLRGPPRYSVSCTVLNDGGLTYLVVTTPLPKRRWWMFWR